MPRRYPPSMEDRGPNMMRLRIARPRAECIGLIVPHCTTARADLRRAARVKLWDAHGYLLADCFVSAVGVGDGWRLAVEPRNERPRDKRKGR